MLVQAPTPLALFLLTPFNPAHFTEHSCLSSVYYGTYGSLSIFRPDVACLDVQFTRLPSSSITLTATEPEQLVWIEEKAADQSLKSGLENDQLDLFLSRLDSPNDVDAHDQDVLTVGQEYSQLLYRSATSALISTSPDKSLQLSTFLPPFFMSVPLPSSPVPYIPVPSAAVERVKHLLSTLKFDPDIAAIVNNISVAQMTNDIRWLTGEDGISGIESRHSFAPGSRVAAEWLKERFEDTGANCELKPFRTGFAPNVVCQYSSTTNTTATVLLSAHYDSRGSFGSTRAPGANDDGSGTVALLSIARTIARKGLSFESNVQLVAFAGEEQGLYGSQAYSRELRAADANLTLMIQADMLAYHAVGEPPQLGLPDRIGTPEVTQLIGNVSAIYSPELKVGFTPACCSDHQSFHEQGFPSSQVYERAGPIADPMYHNSGDLSERIGYDLHQVRSIAKVQFATLLHAAGFTLGE